MSLPMTAPPAGFFSVATPTAPSTDVQAPVRPTTVLIVGVPRLRSILRTRQFSVSATYRFVPLRKTSFGWFSFAVAADVPLLNAQLLGPVPATVETMPAASIFLTRQLSPSARYVTRPLLDMPRGPGSPQVAAGPLTQSPSEPVPISVVVGGGAAVPLQFASLQRRTLRARLVLSV